MAFSFFRVVYCGPRKDLFLVACGLQCSLLLLKDLCLLLINQVVLGHAGAGLDRALPVPPYFGRALIRLCMVARTGSTVTRRFPSGGQVEEAIEQRRKPQRIMKTRATISILVFKKKVLSLLVSPVSGKILLQICFRNTII